MVKYVLVPSKSTVFEFNPCKNSIQLGREKGGAAK